MANPVQDPEELDCDHMDSRVRRSVQTPKGKSTGPWRWRSGTHDSHAGRESMGGDGDRVWSTGVRTGRWPRGKAKDFQVEWYH